MSQPYLEERCNFNLPQPLPSVSEASVQLVCNPLTAHTETVADGPCVHVAGGGHDGSPF